MTAIRLATKRQNANLLIMSTVGMAPKSTQLMGSIATGMVAETEVPRLLIPPQARHWFWKLFDEGETQRLARLTDLPLLAIG